MTQQTFTKQILVANLFASFYGLIIWHYFDIYWMPRQKKLVLEINLHEYRTFPFVINDKLRFYYINIIITHACYPFLIHNLKIYVGL